MRKKIMAANWKMNKCAADIDAFFSDFANLAPVKQFDMEIWIAAPYLYLEKVRKTCKEHGWKAAAQNIHWEDQGAFTGEISIPMLKDCSIHSTLIGHSERRQYYNETDESVHKKLASCEKSGVSSILCIGETLADRDGNLTSKVLETQLTKALRGIPKSYLGKLIVAYEPVWAIGTGRSATPEMIQTTHQYVRFMLGQLYDAAAADTVPILYGGSLKPANAKDILTLDDVDGGLVGGASLDPRDFAELSQILAKV